MVKLMLLMVWRKLIRNPNTYASLLGVIWSLVSNRSNNLISRKRSAYIKQFEIHCAVKSYRILLPMTGTM